MVGKTTLAAQVAARWIGAGHCMHLLLIAGIAITSGTVAQAGALLVAGSPTYDQATSTGLTNAVIRASQGSPVNNSGAAAAFADKYVGGNNMGNRPVRWDASGTAAVELGNLGTDSSGVTKAYARGINAAGTAVGMSYKYEGGNLKGQRAVRWDAASAAATAATELGGLGTRSDGLPPMVGWQAQAGLIPTARAGWPAIRACGSPRSASGALGPPRRAERGGAGRTGPRARPPCRWATPRST